MRTIAICLLLLLTSIKMTAQKRMPDESIMAKVSKGKPFILVFLKTGATPAKDQQTMGKLQMDHLAHLFQLEKDGKICIFGPINNDKTYHGIVVFNTTDKNLVKAELEKDPFIKEGFLTFELFDWFTIPGQKVPAGN